MANKALVYAIYPNEKQNIQCQKTFGCCRFVYNQMLTVQRERHETGEKHLSKTNAVTLDNGYGMFLNMLDYKLRDRGGQLVKVGRFFPSSQLCSQCGFKNTLVKNLSIRHWVCPNCGTTGIDRDVNAARNIKKEGLRLLTA